MPSSQRSEAPRLCKPCNLLFSTWEALMQHKASMRDKRGDKPHYHCHVCGEDFKTEYAEIKHIQQYHAQKQDLHCPGCGKGPFVRVGGLMSHIEKECIRISTQTLEEMRDKKLEFAEKLEILTQDSVKTNYSEYMPSSHGGSVSSGWNSQKPDPFLYKKNDFPHLRRQDLRDRAAPVENPVAKPQSENDPPSTWRQPKNLFPDAPAAKQPTPEQLQTATAPSARSTYEALDPHDPDHPGFNAARYYSEWTESFLCPRDRCQKTFKTKGGLIGHLRSPAHSGKKYRCPYCLKDFTSLTAITQHAEDTGSRCRIRYSDNYDAYMDQLTAGLVDVSLDRHEDGTLKYNTTEKAQEAFGRKVNKGKGKVVVGAEEADQATWDKVEPEIRW